MSNPIVIDTETTSINPHKAKLLFATTFDGVVGQEFNNFPSLYSEPLKIVGHNAKYDAIVLTKNIGGTPAIAFDTMIAQYLLRIDRPKKLESCVKDYYTWNKEDLQQVYNRVTGENRKSLPNKWWEKIPRKDLFRYGVEDAEATYKLWQDLNTQLYEKNLNDWYYNIEMPFANILVQTELEGIKIDKEKLQNLEIEFQRHAHKYETKLKRILGDINLNSSLQLRKVLFETLHLKSTKKTKTGELSTDHHVLEKLSKRHAVAQWLLQYKEVQKLISTYTSSILTELDSNDKLHCNFNQCGTKTRRMASDSPNLQNIPVKSEYGKQIRECFIPEKGHKFYKFDYDQIELRLLAHFSKEPKLITAFKNRIDIHSQTAGLIGGQLGKEFSRDNGKILNFSIVYGKSAYTFAQEWNCSEQEAQQIIDIYFNQYPKVKEWMEEQIAETKRNKGWTKTLMGLPLYIDGLFSNNKWEREHAERMAVNYPIQGSSQDVLKKGVVALYTQYLCTQYKNVVPLLLVHDELIYEVPTDLDCLNAYKFTLENEVHIDVPIIASAKESEYWTK